MISLLDAEPQFSISYDNSLRAFSASDKSGMVSRVVVESPCCGEWLVQRKKVYHPPSISASNRFLWHVMSAKAHTCTDTCEGKVSIRQPQVHQIESIAFLHP